MTDSLYPLPRRLLVHVAQHILGQPFRLSCPSFASASTSSIAKARSQTVPWRALMTPKAEKEAAVRNGEVEFGLNGVLRGRKS